jgi:hypothetical protein
MVYSFTLYFRYFLEQFCDPFVYDHKGLGGLKSRCTIAARHWLGCEYPAETTDENDEHSSWADDAC